MSIHKFFMAVACAATVFSTAGAVQAKSKVLPEVIKTLEQQGFTHITEFDAGADVRGFGGVAGQQPLAVYVTPDGSAIVGTRVDTKGNSLDAQQINELVAKPMSEEIWKNLSDSTWVRDGKKDAPRVVYTFSDANCPYCNRFWEAARPWVDAGKVQLRHVMVGVIRADSSPKAAAILESKDQTAALLVNEKNFANGGIKPAKKVSKEVRVQLDSNQKLMGELGFRGTPGIVFEDESGMVQRVNGMPQDDQLTMVLGKL